MIGINLTENRSEFMHYCLSHMFPFVEVYDVTNINPEIDYLLTDNPQDVTEMGEKVICYKKSFQGFKVITDFSELNKYVRVQRMNIVCATVSDNIILTTLDEAFASKVSTDKGNTFYIDSDALERTVAVIKPITEHTQFVPPVVEMQQSRQEELFEIPDAIEVVPEIVYPMVQLEPEMPTQSFSPALQRHDVQGLSVIKQERGIARRVARDELRIGRTNLSTMSNVVYVFGITPKSGTSSLTYILANYMANIHPDKHTVVVDLDVSKPDLSKLLTTCFSLNPDSDSNIYSLATLSSAEYSESINMLTDEIDVGAGTASGSALLSTIRHTTTAFKDKRLLAQTDFTPRITLLKEFYDYVFVDCGRLEVSSDYQLGILASKDTKLFVADGSSRATLMEFVQDMSTLQIDYKVVINKLSRNATPLLVSRELGKPCLATFAIKNSLGGLLMNGNAIVSVEDNAFLKSVEKLVEELGL